MDNSVALEGFGVGGGMSLNFRVLDGETEPGNKKTNDIWVITPVKVTGYYIQAEQPPAMQPGEVWISTGTSSTVAFNAAKKNTVMVYPLSAKQMLEDGTLADRSAKSWQGDKWVNWWNGELFDNGNQYENVTGGWTCTSSAMNAATITDGKIIVGVSQAIRTANPINNMGKYTRICFNAEAVSGTYHTMILTRTPHGYGSNDGAYGSVDVKNGLNYIEIGAIDSDFYVEFYVARSEGSMTITKVWME